MVPLPDPALRPEFGAKPIEFEHIGSYRKIVLDSAKAEKAIDAIRAFAKKAMGTDGKWLF